MKVGKKFHFQTWISVQLYTIITLIDILSYYQKYICKKRMLQKKHLLQVRAIVVYCIGSMRKKKNEMLSNNYNCWIYILEMKIPHFTWWQMCQRGTISLYFIAYLLAILSNNFVFPFLAHYEVGAKYVGTLCFT